MKSGRDVHLYQFRMPRIVFIGITWDPASNCIMQIVFIRLC